MTLFTTEPAVNVWLRTFATHGAEAVSDDSVRLTWNGAIIIVRTTNGRVSVTDSDGNDYPEALEWVLHLIDENAGRGADTGGDDLEEPELISDEPGVDDDADGLPSLEPAVDRIGRLGDDEPMPPGGNVRTMRDGARRLASNRPQQFFMAPIFDDLVRLYLDAPQRWNDFKSRMGRGMPEHGGTKLAAAVKRRAGEIKQARDERATAAIIGDVEVEFPPELWRLLEVVRSNRSAALTAAAIDVMHRFQLTIDAAVRQLNDTARPLRDDNQIKRIQEVIERLRQMIPAAFAMLREAGAPVGRMKFRHALARRVAGANTGQATIGQAVVDRIAGDEPLPPHWRLPIDYEPQYSEETVDFLSEVMALHPDLYLAHVPVVLRRPLDSVPLMSVQRPSGFLRVLADRINFQSFERDRSIPERLGRALLESADFQRDDCAPAISARHLLAISSSPVMLPDGRIAGLVEGYDRDVMIYFATSPPGIVVPDRPTEADARQSLLALREIFSTFTTEDETPPLRQTDGLLHTDTSKTAGPCETSILALLMTLVQRSVIDIAPGFLLTAADMYGPGMGKGKLVRGINMAATGTNAEAVLPSSDQKEDEKAWKGSLLAGNPLLFIDNFNNLHFGSPLISSLITERRSMLRALGGSPLFRSPRATVVATGNGLFASGDNINRFLTIRMHTWGDTPTGRDFSGEDFVAMMGRRRAEVLSHVFRIMRWGLQRQQDDPRAVPAMLRRRATVLLAQGVAQRELALGEAPRTNLRFPQWDRPIRFPLMLLGCADPFSLQDEDEEEDEDRAWVHRMIATWWACHGDDPVRVTRFDERLRRLFVDRKTQLTLSAEAVGWRLRRLRRGVFRRFTIVRAAGPAGEPAHSTRPWQLEWTGPREEAPRREMPEQDSFANAIF